MDRAVDLQIANRQPDYGKNIFMINQATEYKTIRMNPKDEDQYQII